jgi:hypothetical protein
MSVQFTPPPFVNSQGFEHGLLGRPARGEVLRRLPPALAVTHFICCVNAIDEELSMALDQARDPQAFRYLGANSHDSVHGWFASSGFLAGDRVQHTHNLLALGSSKPGLSHIAFCLLLNCQFQPAWSTTADTVRKTIGCGAMLLGDR